MSVGDLNLFPAYPQPPYCDANGMRVIAEQRARIAELEDALRPFAAIDGIAVQKMKLDPARDRLWSYYNSRTDTQYEITRQHIIDAGRVLKNQ